MNDYLKSLEKYVKDVPLSSFSMEDRGYSDNDEANEFLSNDSFAFICGLIFDQSIKSSLAWKAPFFLKERLGHLSPSEICKMDEVYLKSIIAKKPSLHRYPGPMAKNIIKSSQIVMDSFGGRAEKVWTSSEDPKVIKKNFLKLGGIGDKKANLGIVFLYHDGKIKSISSGDVGLAFDVHLIRVLSRSGMYDFESKTWKDEINSSFEKFYGPEYSSSVGTHIWLIGRKFCHENSPECMFCPLKETCHKEI